MLLTLIRKEILNNLLNTRFAVAYVVCAVLMVGSTANTLTEYLSQKRTQEYSQTVADRVLTERSGMWQILFERSEYRQPTLMQVFCLGTEKLPDTRASLNPYFMPYYMAEPKRDLLPLFFPTVDMLFVTASLVSLLVFMLSYDAFSGEREEGTLKVLLSCPVPRDQVMIAKWLGGFVSVALPYVVSWVVVLMLLVLSPRMTVHAGEYVRMAGLAAAGLVYIATIFSLSVMVSVLCARSGASAITLLAVWVVVVIAVPSLATPAAWLTRRPPSTQLTQVAMQRETTVKRAIIWDDIDRPHVQFLAGRDPDQLRRNDRQTFEKLRRTFQAREFTRTLDGVAGHGRDLTAREAGVDRLARWIMRLSPAGCLHNAFTAIAGTGFEHEQRLRAALEDFAPRAFKAAQNVEYEGRLPKVRLQVHPPSPLQALEQGLFDIGVIALMGLLCFLIAFAVFVRSEVA